MDPTRFDRLTRRLYANRSRRQSVGLLTAIALPALVSPQSATAKKKKSCPPCKMRKKGKCKKTLPDGTACAGGTCQAGSCIASPPPPPPPPPPCGTGEKLCAGDCIPNDACCTQADCPVETFCLHGGCFAGCPNADPDACLVGGLCLPGRCAATVAGPNACITTEDCPSAQPCDTDDECLVGQICAISACCTAFGKPRYCVEPKQAA